MKTKQPDWEAIERAYRAGLLSFREIASSQGITHVAINKRAKRDGWERNLKAKIHAKADALVSTLKPVFITPRDLSSASDRLGQGIKVAIVQGFIDALVTF